MTMLPLAEPPPTAHFTVLPLRAAPGAPEVAVCLGEEAEAWGPALASSTCLLARQGGEVVGLVAAWPPAALAEVEVGRGIASLAAGRAGVVARLWGIRDSLCWLLQPDLLLQLLGSLGAGAGGVAVSLGPAQHALGALLDHLEFQPLGEKGGLVWKELS